jgi:alpha-galactosidase
VLDLNQQAIESKPGLLPEGKENDKEFPQRYWYATTGGPNPKHYVAVFNLADAKTTANLPWVIFHLPNKSFAAYDVWNQKRVPKAKTLQVDLPAHGCALFRIE